MADNYELDLLKQRHSLWETIMFNKFCGRIYHQTDYEIIEYNNINTKLNNYLHTPITKEHTLEAKN